MSSPIPSQAFDTGDAAGDRDVHRSHDHDPGRIRTAVVLRTQQMGPGLIRVVFGGEDMADFTSTGVGDEYVRLFPVHPEPLLFILQRSHNLRAQLLFQHFRHPDLLRCHGCRLHRTFRSSYRTTRQIHRVRRLDLWVKLSNPVYRLQMPRRRRRKQRGRTLEQVVGHKIRVLVVELEVLRELVLSMVS